MFDIGWTEMMVVACVAIIVVGPKDLPKMLRTFGKAIGNIRRLAGDFQRQFNDAIQESEISEVTKSVTENQTFQPLADAKKAMEDFQDTMKIHEENKQKAGTATASGTPGTVADEPLMTAKTEPAPKPVKKTASKTAAKASTGKSAPVKKATAKKPAAGKATASTGKTATARKAAPTKPTQAKRGKTPAKQDNA